MWTALFIFGWHVFKQIEITNILRLPISDQSSNFKYNNNISSAGIDNILCRLLRWRLFHNSRSTAECEGSHISLLWCPTKSMSNNLCGSDGCSQLTKFNLPNSTAGCEWLLLKYHNSHFQARPTMELSRGANSTPNRFFNFLRNPVEYFEKVIMETLICNVLILEYFLKVDPPNVTGKIRNAISEILLLKPIKLDFKKIFHDYAYLSFSHSFVWFYYIFVISNWNCEQKSQFNCMTLSWWPRHKPVSVTSHYITLY